MAPPGCATGSQQTLILNYLYLSILTLLNTIRAVHNLTVYSLNRQFYKETKNVMGQLTAWNSHKIELPLLIHPFIFLVLRVATSYN